LVILPEGSISGYSHDLSFLKSIDQHELESGLVHLHLEAQQRKIHLWVGACLYKDGRWFNASIGYSPDGEKKVYHKVNLGVQICRELRFPEQWGWLARCGAQIILYLNNAVGHAWNLPIWQSHLISRAAETQRFVLGANNAAPEQNSPTIAASPDGRVLNEIVSNQLKVMRVDLDLSLVSNWYLNRCRTDLVTISPGKDNPRREQC
jgi:predicted amidohydrolase